MRALAEKLGGDPDTWETLGLLHDADWEETKDMPDEHTKHSLAWLKELGETEGSIVHALMSHNRKHTHLAELEGTMEWALETVDELTGFIVAVALVRPEKKLETVPVLEKKLLLLRKKREQPFVDRKIITSWNSLLGIAFVMAERCGCSIQGYKKAEMLFHTLLKKHYTHKDSSKKLAHSSLGNNVQSQEFLEDYAALLLVATYLYEIYHDDNIQKLIKELFLTLDSFYDLGRKQWIESRNVDFIVPDLPGDEADQRAAPRCVQRQGGCPGGRFEGGVPDHPGVPPDHRAQIDRPSPVLQRQRTGFYALQPG